jgi:hypothetical protein
MINYTISDFKIFLIIGGITHLTNYKQKAKFWTFSIFSYNRRATAM